ncbi:MAG TPA: D-lyxose/D-mannose family sugar isomerase [Candidatus Sumerlaeota bacterium]|nr:D-lyxose/D-mannose family sugar isomerase [Candidatus Sumerlaeota bacterium]
MKRSEINHAIADAMLAFQRHDWALPPEPRWDVTGFGLGDFSRFGLTLVNLTELPQYCEKIMFARAGQITPIHKHNSKQEDIIARVGVLAIQIFAQDEAGNFLKHDGRTEILLNGNPEILQAGTILYLKPGERVTLRPGCFHQFWPVSAYAIIGEVSTYNDDVSDNVFVDERVGRFEAIMEDEPAICRLISD